MRSGGDLYIAQAESDLSEVFAGITERLRQQYIRCYYRSNSDRTGLSTASGSKSTAPAPATARPPAATIRRRRY